MMRRTDTAAALAMASRLQKKRALGVRWCTLWQSIVQCNCASRLHISCRLPYDETP
jgi:hypothetical protein